MKGRCGRSHFERVKPKKKEFKGTLTATAAIPSIVELTTIELYSSYLGKVPVRAKVVGENVYLESVYETKTNKKIYIKILDLLDNNIDDNYMYQPQQLVRLTSIVINKNENIYKYFITLYCYLRINQLEQSTENIEKYKKLIDEIKTDALLERLNKDHPVLLEEKITISIAKLKKMLQSVTTYNSRVDILFAALEYLEFISYVTDNVLETINNQDILIFISGVPNLDNAYWNGKYMVFGNGDSIFYPLTSIDVIGHELTHGLIQGVCDLDYKGHSGALNESYADIFGTMLEFYIYDKYKDKLLGKGDWLIGEELTINDSCLRSLEDPNSSEQPAKMFDKYYVDPTSMIDYGGVHINSGIPNHCFYIASQLMDKFESLKLFINCLFKLLHSSDFYEFSDTLSIISKDDVSSSKDDIIINALTKVGLSPRYNSPPSSKQPQSPSKTPTPRQTPPSKPQSPRPAPKPKFPYPPTTPSLPSYPYPPTYPYPYPSYPPNPYPSYPYPSYPYSSDNLMQQLLQQLQSQQHYQQQPPPLFQYQQPPPLFHHQQPPPLFHQQQPPPFHQHLQPPPSPNQHSKPPSPTHNIHPTPLIIPLPIQTQSQPQTPINKKQGDFDFMSRSESTFIADHGRQTTDALSGQPNNIINSLLLELLIRRGSPN